MLNLYNLEKVRDLDREMTRARRQRAEWRGNGPSPLHSMARLTAWVPRLRRSSRPAPQPIETTINDPAGA